MLFNLFFFTITALSLIFSTPQTSYASYGIPMILFSWPIILIFTIPFILIKVIVFRKIVPGITVIYKWQWISNAVTLFIGIPTVWVVGVCLQVAAGGATARNLASLKDLFIASTLQSPWYIYPSSVGYWLIPASIACLCFFYFLISCYIDFFVAKIGLIGFQRKLVRDAALISNFFCYIPIISILIIYSVFKLKY